MYGKSIFASKTFWLNVALFTATYVLSHQNVLTELHFSAQTIAAILAVANIVNRFLTSGPVYVVER